MRLIATKLYQIRHANVSGVNKFAAAARGDPKSMCGHVIYNQMQAAVEQQWSSSGG